MPAGKRDLDEEEDESAANVTTITIPAKPKHTTPPTAKTETTKSKQQTTNETPEVTTFRIYPNPNNGTFTIEVEKLESPKSKVELKIMNLLGQVIYQSIINNPSTIINLKDAPIGIYILHLQTENEIITRKIVKE